MNGYQRGLIRGQIPILLLVLAAAAWAGWRLPDFAVEAGTDVLLDQADPDLAYYNQTRADWGSDEYVIVCCHRNEGWFTPASLGLLADFNRALRRQPYVRSVLSIAGVPLLRNKPAGLFPVPVFLVDADGNLDPKVDLAKAQAELLDHTQARGNLISADGKDLSILVTLDVPEEANRLEPERNRLLGGPRTAESDRRLKEIEGPFQASVQEQNARRGLLVAAIRKLAAAWRPSLDEPVRLSGLPIINIVLREHIKSDITTFGIVALTVFTLTFLGVYRRPRWVILPILSCILPVALMLGLMVAMGRKTTVITSNMPVLLFVLTLPYAVYYIERYLERRGTHPDEDPKVTATRAPVEIWSPCLFSVLATMVGTAAHIPSGIIPVRTFGVMMTIGMGLSLAVIMLFLPATVLPLKAVGGAGAAPDKEPPGPLKALLALVLRAPKAVMIFSLVVLAVSIWGTTKIKVETKFIDYFRAKSEIYQGLDYIDNRMGGTTPFEVILKSPTPGFFKTPEGLAALDSVGRFVESIPEKGNVRSLKTLVDEAKKAFADKNGVVRAKDAQILGLVTGMARDQVREFCNPDFTVSRVLIRMKETAPTLNRNRILGLLRDYLASKKDTDLNGVEARPTGVFLLYANMLNTLIRSTKETFVLAVVGIWLMLLVLFRSPVMATLVLLPQVLPVLLVLGVMGFFGVALDMVTVIIASVAMGVGIDAAIQYAVRFRSEFEKAGGDLPAAIRRSHATIGRAILIATSIVFAGFAMLCFSQFVPTIYFGLFTGIAILMGLFASLTTLPASFLLLNYPRRKPADPAPR
ncbi:MAG: MMPL family transporter [Planctomycetaceae bacterium]|nr:MMPL family transporter [Planctomycetaceae bacterium]